MNQRVIGATLLGLLTAAHIGLSVREHHIRDEQVRFAHAVTSQGMLARIYDPEPIIVAIGPATEEERKMGLEGEDPGWANRSVQALEAELRSVPGFYPQACELSSVRIMRDIRFEGEPLDGFYTKGVVYLDTDSIDPRSVVIHELNHLCVDKNGSTLFFPWMLAYNRFTGAGYVGDDWEHTSVAGFARGYGAKNRFEDIATMAEDVIGRPELSAIVAERDETYADKAERVRGFYARLGHPLFMNEQ